MNKIMIFLVINCFFISMWTMTPKRVTNSIMEAARYGDLDTLRKEIEAGANVNTQENYRRVLHVACQFEHPSIVEELLKSGANVHEVDFGDYQRTALVWAVTNNKNNDNKIVELLIQYGADPNASDRRCYVLEYALIGSHYNALQALIKAGASLDIIDQRILSDITPETSMNLYHAKNYISNLKKGVSRRWNFSKSLSLRDRIVKSMYENYLNGDSEVLQELLRDPNLPVNTKKYLNATFKPSFIHLLQGLNPKESAAKTVEKFVSKRVDKKRSAAAKAAIQAMEDAEFLDRTKVEQRFDQSMQELMQQATLDPVPAKRQEALR